MKTFKRIIIVLGVAVLIAILLPLSMLGYWRLTYYSEMNNIRDRLNRILNVSVVNIWGHDDITLEEVTARLSVKDKGEVVLYGLSQDVYNYPETIRLLEIGGFSFIIFYENSVGFALDIGQKGPSRDSFPFGMVDESEVVQKYDDIISVVRSWPVWPELHHVYSHDGEEMFIAVMPQKTDDRDPIYNLARVKSLFEFKDTLPWGRRREKRPGSDVL